MIEIGKELIGGGDQVLVGGRIMGRESDASSQLHHQFGALIIRKGFNLSNNLSRRARHASSFPRAASQVKASALPGWNE